MIVIFVLVDLSRGPEIIVATVNSAPTCCIVGTVNLAGSVAIRKHRAGLANIDQHARLFIWEIREQKRDSRELNHGASRFAYARESSVVGGRKMPAQGVPRPVEQLLLFDFRST